MGNENKLDVDAIEARSWPVTMTVDERVERIRKAFQVRVKVDIDDWPVLRALVEREVKRSEDVPALIARVRELEARIAKSVECDWQVEAARLFEERGKERAHADKAERELTEWKERVGVEHETCERALSQLAEVEAQAAVMREALTTIDMCILWSDTMQQWCLVGKERSGPALSKVRAALLLDAGRALAERVRLSDEVISIAREFCACSTEKTCGLCRALAALDAHGKEHGR